MRPFRFRLEKVLRLRRQELEEAKRQLAVHASRCQNLLGQIELRQGEVIRAQSSIQDADFLWRWSVERYAVRMNHEIERLKQELRSAEIEREKAAEVYRQALARSKALENLQRRRFELYRKERNRAEVNTADDAWRGDRGES